MNTLFATEPSHPQVLRFHRPPAAAPEDLTLDHAFERLKLEELRDRAAVTIGEYHTHLRRWRECFADLRTRADTAGERWKYRMSYPVLAEIGRAELRIFRDWLASQVKEDGHSRFSNRTVNKHLGSVTAILRAADEEELIVKAPKIKPLETIPPDGKLWLTPDQVDALMEGCAAADWPRGLPHAASTYWRALAVLFCNYGFRTQEIVSHESSKEPLDWRCVSWDAETPHPRGHAANEWGWFTYTPSKQRRKKPQPLVLPLNETAHRWLQLISDGRRAGPVIPFPLNNGAFYETWRRIIRAAGIRPKPSLDGSQDEYQPQHLRKTAITWLNDHGARIGCPAIAEKITGHSDDRSPDALVAVVGGPTSKVQQVHYDSAENRVLQAVLTLPQPPSFARLPLPYRRFL